MTRPEAAADTGGMHDLPDKPPGLDFPLGLIEECRASYAPEVVWTAPRRGVHWVGRDQVMANLLRESAAMHGVQVTRLRRSSAEGQVIDEFVARFTYAGSGIQNLRLPAGATIELERVRILTLRDNLVRRENAIETWTVLGNC